jgi:hypothetical protein
MINLVEKKKGGRPMNSENAFDTKKVINDYRVSHAVVDEKSPKLIS